MEGSQFSTEEPRSIESSYVETASGTTGSTAAAPPPQPAKDNMSMVYGIAIVGLAFYLIASN